MTFEVGQRVRFIDEGPHAVNTGGPGSMASVGDEGIITETASNNIFVLWDKTGKTSGAWSQHRFELVVEPPPNRCFSPENVLFSVVIADKIVAILGPNVKVPPSDSGQRIILTSRGNHNYAGRGFYLIRELDWAIVMDDDHLPVLVARKKANKC